VTPFNLLSKTTIESQMVGQPRFEFKFVRSRLDRFFAAISWFITGILFLLLVILSWFIELPFLMLVILIHLGTALGIWGTMVLVFPYETRFNSTDRTIERRFRILLYWWKTIVPKEKIDGLEVRKYLTRSGSVKEWEFWLHLDNSRSIFIARTKHPTSADKWLKALVKRFHLKLLS